MAYLFDTGIFSAEGLAGEILVGAKLEWYGAGGSTPLATYSDQGLTTPNANPVVSGADGRWGPIWLQSASYKYVLKNAVGVMLVTRDNIRGDTDAGLRTALAAPSGASLVGFNLGATGSIDRNLGDRDRDWVSIFDFIPLAQQAAIIAGTSTYDCTSDIHAARDHVKGTGQTLHFVGGTYYVSTVVVNGSDYAIDTSAGVTFKQKPGLSDGDEHAIIRITEAENITIGDFALEGNIDTDTLEYNHGLGIGQSNNIKVGCVTGRNIRGDLCYLYGRVSSEAEKNVGIIIDSLTGDNIHRCILAAVGGEARVGQIIQAGPVGFRVVDVEPNSGGDYQPVTLHVGYARGGTFQVVSDDVLIQNDSVRFDVMDLDWNLIEDSSAGYPSFPGANAIGLSWSDCRDGHIGILKVRDFPSYPISLGPRWDHLTIDTLDISNCNQTEATFNSVIVQQGTPGNGVLDIGYVKCVHTANTKWLVRSNAAGQKVRIGGGYVSGGLLSLNCALNVNALVLDAGNASGGSANIIASGSLSCINNMSISNAGSATLLYGSSGCLLNGVTGTVGNIVSSTSNNNSITNSTLNGKSFQYRTQSSDASVAVASAATVTLPLDRDVVTISGTTNITSVTAGADNADRRVTLIFQGILNFTDGSNLKLASTMATTADDTITICCDGTNWYEVGRSIN